MLARVLPDRAVQCRKNNYDSLQRMRRELLCVFNWILNHPTAVAESRRGEDDCSSVVHATTHAPPADVRRVWEAAELVRSECARYRQDPRYLEFPGLYKILRRRRCSVSHRALMYLMFVLRDCPPVIMEALQDLTTTDAEHMGTFFQAVYQRYTLLLINQHGSNDEPHRGDNQAAPQPLLPTVTHTSHKKKRPIAPTTAESASVLCKKNFVNYFFILHKYCTTSKNAGKYGALDTIIPRFSDSFCKVQERWWNNADHDMVAFLAS